MDIRQVPPTVRLPGIALAYPKSLYNDFIHFVAVSVGAIGTEALGQLCDTPIAHCSTSLCEHPPREVGSWSPTRRVRPCKKTLTHRALAVAASATTAGSKHRPSTAIVAPSRHDSVLHTPTPNPDGKA